MASLTDEQRKHYRSSRTSTITRLHGVYWKLGQQEKSEVDLEVWKKDLQKQFFVATHDGSCFVLSRPNDRLGCHCMEELPRLLSWKQKNQIWDYLLEFAMMNPDQQQVLVTEWIKYAEFASQHAHRQAKNQCYLLPGCATIQVCRSALARLIGFGYVKWMTCHNAAKNNTVPCHALKGRPSNSKLSKESYDALSLFFEKVRLMAMPRATKIVRTMTGHGDEYEDLTRDENLIKLPPHLAKRRLYQRFLQDNGWRADQDNIGRTTRNKLRDDALHDPPAWATFVGYWKSHHEDIVIQKASEDICDKCYVFANAHKYKTDHADDEELPIIPKAKPKKRKSEGEEEDDTTAGLAQILLMKQEDIILKATVHVGHAREQRELFRTKKEEATLDSAFDTPQEDRTFCFVGDFAQNVMLPNMAGHQPGATYYYSALNLFPFGLVDASTWPSQLNAHLFVEGDAKKGGNSVASMLWKDLKLKGLVNGKTCLEINYVFDNCAGQNKNRMVLRFLFILVKLKICQIARAIFLIKGHTKNDCDRTFNLMKLSYRKENIYTPQQLMEHISRHPQVTGIAMEEHEFFNWDALEARLAKPVKDVSQYHIFTVDAKRDSNKMYLQRAAGEDEESQLLVKREWRDADWNSLIAELEVVPPPGLQDIKGAELYYKWNKFVPPECRPQCKYFREAPPTDMNEAVVEHTIEARKQRAKRKRTVHKAAFADAYKTEIEESKKDS